MAEKYQPAQVGEEKISGTMKIYPPPPIKNQMVRP